MIAEPLSRVLESTGYLVAGKPAAPTVSLANGAGPMRLRSLHPDAMWTSTATDRMLGIDAAVDLSTFFKFAGTATEAAGTVAEWQQDIWNHGFVALLWVVWADRVEIYNGFGTPRQAGNEGANLLETFDLGDSDLAALDSFAGRLAMETGEFWVRQGHRVDRRTGVDTQLLGDLRKLERGLVSAGLEHREAQVLIGRTIFANYLIDRKVVTTKRLHEICGGRTVLSDIMDDRDAAIRLFEWLRDEFNGDMFPAPESFSPQAAHLRRVGSFLRAENPETGQRSLFPYRFDVIPVELISSIYEDFVHSSATVQRDAGEARLAQDVHYTPLTAVSMVLDQVFDGLTGDETVIDLTCGSGVFLVESLRRLVRLKVRGGTPDRSTIRSVLYEQVFGVDKSEAAIRIAALSLYLAALELDPDPSDPRSRGFEPLIGRTLLVGNARTVDQSMCGKRVLTSASGLKTFDVIVGNPPWSYAGKAGMAIRKHGETSTPLPPRGRGFDFVHRGIDFSHQDTRFGMLVSALPFFSRSSTGLRAAHHLVDSLGAVTLTNLAELSNWLFPRANMPAMAVVARNREEHPDSMQLFQACRSRKTDRSQTIELTASDSTTLPVDSWKRNPGLCKASFVGHKHDRLLVDRLWGRYRSLGDELEALGTRLASGLIMGSRSNRTREAGFIANLPFLAGGRLNRFAFKGELRPFTERHAHWPRKRAIYRSPLVVVREYITKAADAHGRGRAVVGVSERDLVYNDSYYGISLPDADRSLAYLLAGVLSSSLASWFFLMTGSSFGVWQQRLLLGDINALPTPTLEEAAATDAGKRISELVRSFHARIPAASGWDALDQLVCDLYELDAEERIVIQDGWLRSTWEWSEGRSTAIEVAPPQDLENYAKAFMVSMDAWLHAANERRLSAEIYDFGQDATYRVVRFVLEDHPPPSSQIRKACPHMSVRDFLGTVGTRLRREIHRELVGSRELRIHSPREVFIVKPAARRFWLGVSGLDDAQAVIMESVMGRQA